jgi:uncharacterized membrane protein YfhO
VTIEARTEEPGILVLADTHYPGWIVEIDGEPAETLPANYLFRSVALPPGSHRVTFRYEPRSFRIGAAISLAALGALAAAVAVERWYRRRRPGL